MKWVILIVLSVFVLPVLASAAKGELVENLCYDEDLYDWDWAFSSFGGSYPYRVAFDYDPDGAYLVDRVKIDWIYQYNVSCRDDIDFEIYLDDFDDPPVFDFVIPEEDYTESDTGFEYVGRDVYRGDLPLGSDAFGVTTGNEYWIALQMDASDGVFATGWFSIVGDRPWYHDISGWHHHQSGYDCSYAIYGEVTGIESASLGEIKATFR